MTFDLLEPVHDDDAEAPIDLGALRYERRIEHCRSIFVSIRLASLRFAPTPRDAVEACSIDEALDLVEPGVPDDLRRLARTFAMAPATELDALRPYLACLAAADPSPEAAARRALFAHDVAIRRCLPVVLRSHRCFEFAAELVKLPPLERRRLRQVGTLLEIVQEQIARRVTDWYGTDRASFEARRLLGVRDDLVGAARSYNAALERGDEATVDPFEGPGLLLAAAGESAGWDEVSWWDFLAPVLELADRPSQFGELHPWLHPSQVARHLRLLDVSSPILAT